MMIGGRYMESDTLDLLAAAELERQRRRRQRTYPASYPQSLRRVARAAAARRAAELEYRKAILAARQDRRTNLAIAMAAGVTEAAIRMTLKRWRR